MGVFQFLMLADFRTVPDLYAEKLIQEGVLTNDKVKEITTNHTEWLNNELKSTDNYYPEVGIIP